MSLENLTKKATKALSKVPELKDSLLSTKSFAIAAFVFCLAAPTSVYAQDNSEKLKDVAGAAAIGLFFNFFAQDANVANSAVRPVIDVVSNAAGDEMSNGVKGRRSRSAMENATEKVVRAAAQGGTDAIGLTTYKKTDKKFTSYNSGNLHISTLNVPGVANSSRKIVSKALNAYQLKANNKKSFFNEDQINNFINMPQDGFTGMFNFYTNQVVEKYDAVSVDNLQLLIDIAKVKYPNDNYKDAAIQAINNSTQLALGR